MAADRPPPRPLSAGIVVYRRRGGVPEVLLGHMGGPFWARKDAGAWSIPKGEVDGDDDVLATARREFAEEFGRPVPAGDLLDLGRFTQSSRKVIHIWAVEGDLDPTTCSSNTFDIEWPPGSGTVASFPEIDRAEWFAFDVAREKIVRGQRQVLDALESHLT